MSSDVKYKLYYFSGTGNARAVAHWMKEEAERQGVKMELSNLAAISRKGLSKAYSGTTLGFVSATHGFNFPPIMFHFLLRFPRGNGNRVFIVNTRAGMKLSRFFLPGLSGMTLYLSALILLFKGYRIQALKSVDLPSNWISLHPGIKKKVCDSIKAKRENETRRFAKRIIKGDVILRGLYPIIIDILITPVALLYYFVGRFFLAKTFIASRDCSNCGICDQSCPVNAIKIVDGRRFWSYKCESCMQCMNQCPERAIETAHGFVALVIFVLDAIALVYLNQLFDISGIIAKIMPEFLVGFMNFVVNNVILIFLIFLSYRLMHYLMRFKIVERLVILTSLTHWRLWRRYHFSGKAK